MSEGEYICSVLNTFRIMKWWVRNVIDNTFLDILARSGSYHLSWAQRTAELAHTHIFTLPAGRSTCTPEVWVFEKFG